MRGPDDEVEAQPSVMMGNTKRRAMMIGWERGWCFMVGKCQRMKRWLTLYRRDARTTVDRYFYFDQRNWIS